MDTILNEIDRAIDAELYFAALALCLTLPDICAALESSNGESNGNKYKNWYSENLQDNYPNITPADIWSLRCGVTYQGRFGNPQMQYERVLFTIPNPQGNVFHNNMLNDALNLDAVTFCRDVMSAVRAWYTEKEDDENVLANLPHLVKFHPNGLAPYFRGVPLIS
jgi:hypothetical protein